LAFATPLGDDKEPRRFFSFFVFRVPILFDFAFPFPSKKKKEKHSLPFRDAADALHSITHIRNQKKSYKEKIYLTLCA
jgi:hypothetical protein